VILAAVFFTIAVAVLGFVMYMTRMPGKSLPGPLPAASVEEIALASRLRHHVVRLAAEIGPRDMAEHPAALNQAADYIAANFKEIGFDIEKQEYGVGDRVAANLIVTLHGSRLASEIVVVGAHYDTVPETPGADDNASGIAGLIETARLIAADKPSRTIRFVAFTNEEPPCFQTDAMGSVRYARSLKAAKQNIVAMLSLEMLGYYDARPHRQHYPAPLGMLYPDAGDFMAIVGDIDSRKLVRHCVGVFRARGTIPAEGAALPADLAGVGWSDHWSFWENGYPAVMATDTALFRNPNYHRSSDMPETLDYERFARAVKGIVEVVRNLAASQ